MILDEAHYIKNRKTLTAKACFLLNSSLRWCLTGTPIQNHLDDLFSLIHFLNFKPYCNYEIWKGIIVQQIQRKPEVGLNKLKVKKKIFLFFQLTLFLKISLLCKR